MNESHSLDQILDSALAFQRKWQRLSMLAHVTSTLCMLGASTGATYFAASNQSQTAAILAGVATISVGLEKSLLFREKWKFHLGIATQLFVLKTHAQTGALSSDELAKRLSAILGQYADALPIAPRDNTL